MSGTILKDRISEIKQLCQDDSNINNPKMRIANNSMNHYDEVYPGIFIGDEYITSKKGELKKIGISHIVNAAQGNKFCQINTNDVFYQDVNIAFLGIPANDTFRFKMKEYFESSSMFIENALAENGKVYVHCFQGISRSASIVLAFLITKRRMNLTEAVIHIKQSRRIFPNDGFIAQLIELEDSIMKTQDLPAN